MATAQVAKAMRKRRAAEAELTDVRKMRQRRKIAQYPQPVIGSEGKRRDSELHIAADLPPLIDGDGDGEVEERKQYAIKPHVAQALSRELQHAPPSLEKEQAIEVAKNLDREIEKAAIARVAQSMGDRVAERHLMIRLAEDELQEALRTNDTKKLAELYKDRADQSDIAKQTYERELGKAEKRLASSTDMAERASIGLFMEGIRLRLREMVERYRFNLAKARLYKDRYEASQKGKEKEKGEEEEEEGAKAEAVAAQAPTQQPVIAIEPITHQQPLEEGEGESEGGSLDTDAIQTSPRPAADEAGPHTPPRAMSADTPKSPATPQPMTDDKIRRELKGFKVDDVVQASLILAQKKDLEQVVKELDQLAKKDKQFGELKRGVDLVKKALQTRLSDYVSRQGAMIRLGSSRGSYELTETGRKAFNALNATYNSPLNQAAKEKRDRLRTNMANYTGYVAREKSRLKGRASSEKKK